MCKYLKLNKKIAGAGPRYFLTYTLYKIVLFFS